MSDPDARAALAGRVDDPARLAAVAELGLTGHARDTGLDAVVTTLATALSVPMAVVNIVTPDLQTYAAEVGVDLPCTAVPDGLSFCAAVVETGSAVQVPDASAHPVYAENPLVQAGVVAAYAGHPLLHDGVVVGAVSIFDARPRRFDDGELAVLAAQAELAASVLSLRWAATHDGLTGLSNRARTAELGRGAVQEGGPVSVLFVDVDDFKTVNDAYGHTAGDDVLRELGGQLQTRLAGTGGVLARWGGDEFLVLLPGAGAAAAEQVATRLRTGLEPVGGPGLTVGLTVGVATREYGDTWDDVVRHAGDAARAGKTSGSGVTVYTGALRAVAYRRERLRVDLVEALDDGSLTLHYQPVLRSSDGRLHALEALVRWRRLGVMVPPAEFVPLAEESALVLALGRRVLDLACAQLAGWRRAHPGAADIRVWVNVSARQLDDPGLVGQVRAALQRHALPAHALGVEVTETAAALDRSSAAAALRELHHVGVLVALDDFGSGYSSLSRLRQLDVDVLKLDRGFVTGLGPRQSERLAFARAVVELGHALGLPVVAEGVETAAERDVLLDLGCDHLQGYLVGRPVPAAEVPAVMGWEPVAGATGSTEAAGSTGAPAERAAAPPPGWAGGRAPRAPAVAGARAAAAVVAAPRVVDLTR
jgi:diguanylate cyclase (GGDEF)-like protein